MIPVINIESNVPFGHLLYVKLEISGFSLNDLPGKTWAERNYLAWETVRKQTNPYFIEGTGFEGYLIGNCHRPEEAIEAIVDVNQQILDAIARLYHYQYGLRSRLWKTLTREYEDTDSIHIWSAYLGAALGRLRCHVSRNWEAVLFQTQTYRIVSSLPPITYHTQPGMVSQAYAIGKEVHPLPARIQVSRAALKPCQQDAWLVAQNIGQFGHPLVRNILDTG